MAAAETYQRLSDCGMCVLWFICFVVAFSIDFDKIIMFDICMLTRTTLCFMDSMVGQLIL
jgi:hypothetical protein